MRGASRMTTLDTLTVADVERQKLQRHFGRYDILFFLICTIVSVGKWLPTAGAFARFIVLGLFTLSVIIYAGKHGAHGLGASSYSPSAGGFVLLVGVLLFNFVGFELPNSAGEEMTNPQRDVPFAIARSGVASVVLYALPVIGILIVLPTG